MNKKPEIKRWSRTVTLAGSSLNVTIPADLVKQWGIRQGEQVVAYQINDLLLICPLATILASGQPKEISQIVEALT